MNLTKKMRLNIAEAFVKATFDSDWLALKRRLEALTTEACLGKWGELEKKILATFTSEEISAHFSVTPSARVYIDQHKYYHATDQVYDTLKVPVEGKKDPEPIYALPYTTDLEKSVVRPRNSSTDIILSLKGKKVAPLHADFKAFHKQTKAAYENALIILNSVKTVEKLKELTPAFDKWIPKDPGKLGALLPIDAIEAVNALSKKAA